MGGWHGADSAARPNVDIAGRKPKKLLPGMQLHADWAVTMGCDDACPYVPTVVEAWDIPEPAGRPPDEVRAIRDTIEAHVRELVETKLDATRSDPTAHRLRLQRLLPQLAEEFEDRRSVEDIRACADAILARFDDVPVRSHVLTIAHRLTRDRLRQETCDALQTTTV